MRFESIVEALELPREFALTRVRELQRCALLDKQPSHLTGDVMITKTIGGKRKFARGRERTGRASF